MKKYICHKTVEAASIKSVTQLDAPFTPDSRVDIEFDEGGGRRRLRKWFRGEALPGPGDYWVRYLDGDGYESWSPRHVFEAGYTEVLP